MPRTDDVRLRHMLDAARRAADLVRERTREHLDSDDVLVLALTRLLEILGEAAKNVSGTTQARYAEIPWRQMAATRDRLIHGYFSVDLDVLWEIVAHDLPPLIPALEAIVSAPDE